MMPAPYYDRDGVTLYHGDCRDILPHIPDLAFDLLATDPPYGIKRDGQPETFTKQARHKRKHHAAFGWDEEPPDAETFDHLFRVSRDQVIWGANYFTPHLPPSMGWLVWDKGQRLSMSDAELAFTSRAAALRVCTVNRGAIALDGAEHPTQKPERLMHWCLGMFPGIATVFDPYAGSGTTLRAAKNLGLRAVGIEREEHYCRVIVDRLQQAVLPGLQVG